MSRSGALVWERTVGETVSANAPGAAHTPSASTSGEVCHGDDRRLQLIRQPSQTRLQIPPLPRGQQELAGGSVRDAVAVGPGDLPAARF
jgi:hypothetical protein